MLRIEENDNDLRIPRLDGGGVPIIEYRGTLFTGVVFKKRKDGSLVSEEEYDNGFQEGWIRYYHKNGKLAQEYKDHNNVELDGTFKKWDENGNLILSY